MQDQSSLYSQIKSQVNYQHNQQQQHENPQFPEQEHLKCPRCDSINTKFCYYNNYNLSQPRHFCKSCKRYWTKGGTLRNIPVGGASRKNTKRSSSAAATSAKRPAQAAAAVATATATSGINETLNLKGDHFEGHFGNFMDVTGGSFSSLLGSSGGQFGNLLGPNPFGDLGSGQNVDPQVFESGNSNEWTDLAMYTPGGSTFH